MAEEFKPLQPSVPVQIVSVLEDAGLVNIANANWTFGQAMFGPSFILPDEVVWLLVFASIGYSAMVLGWV